MKNKQNFKLNKHLYHSISDLHIQVQPGPQINKQPRKDIIQKKKKKHQGNLHITINTQIILKKVKKEKYIYIETSTSYIPLTKIGTNVNKHGRS